MKIEPVYLVAPRPRVTTRRAFVWCALTGSAGVALGSATGFWLGRATASQPRPAAAPTSIDASLQRRIQWAREVIAAGSDVALLANAPALVSITHESLQAGLDDDQLWDGVMRLAVAALADPDTARVQLRYLETTLSLRADRPGHTELIDRLRQRLR